MQPALMSFEKILALEHPPPDFRVNYGEHPLQFGELRLPAGAGPHPVAIVVHGGCWRSQYDIGHIGNLADAFRQAGIATWALEYRRVGDPGGGWPGTFLDVASGTDHLRSLTFDHRLDLSRVVAVGHSAGGHLVLWLAARAKLAPESAIRGGRPLPLAGVVPLAAVDDLRRAVAEGVCGDMAVELLGGTPEAAEERYGQASPIELLPLGVALHVVHGARDPIVPVAFARRFAAAAERSGDRVQSTILPEVGHFELIDGTSTAGATVVGAARGLLTP